MVTARLTINGWRYARICICTTVHYHFIHVRKHTQAMEYSDQWKIGKWGKRPINLTPPSCTAFCDEGKYGRERQQGDQAHLAQQQIIYKSSHSSRLPTPRSLLGRERQESFHDVSDRQKQSDRQEYHMHGTGCNQYRGQRPPGTVLNHRRLN